MSEGREHFNRDKYHRNYALIDWGDRRKSAQAKPRKVRAKCNLLRPFRRHHSWIHGRDLTSWSEYHNANKELGIIDTGEKPGPPQDTTPPPSPKVGVHTE